MHLKWMCSVVNFFSQASKQDNCFKQVVLIILLELYTIALDSIGKIRPDVSSGFFFFFVGYCFCLSEDFTLMWFLVDNFLYKYLFNLIFCGKRILHFYVAKSI